MGSNKQREREQLALAESQRQRDRESLRDRALQGKKIPLRSLPLRPKKPRPVVQVIPFPPQVVHVQQTVLIPAGWVLDGRLSELLICPHRRFHLLGPYICDDCRKYHSTLIAQVNQGEREGWIRRNSWQDFDEDEYNRLALREEIRRQQAEDASN